MNRKPSTDDIVRAVVGDPRRRRILAYLRETDSEWVTAREVATHIAASNQEVSTADVSDDVADTVHLTLVHSHLPRLAEHDVIEYVPHSGVISPAERFADVRPLLDAASEVDGVGQLPLTSDARHAG